ncbi:MAG: alkylhydroperoxidase/carboxymuconolactone decarboxylase family protein YurZ, partial [Paraglaciecola sp.]
PVYGDVIVCNNRLKAPPKYICNANDDVKPLNFKGSEQVKNTLHIERYGKLKDLSRKLILEIPEMMAGFGELHAMALVTRALDTKSKELIALGIAIAVHCNSSIGLHGHDALCCRG